MFLPQRLHRQIADIVAVDADAAALRVPGAIEQRQRRGLGRHRSGPTRAMVLPAGAEISRSRQAAPGRSQSRRLEHYLAAGATKIARIVAFGDGKAWCRESRRSGPNSGRTVRRSRRTVPCAPISMSEKPTKLTMPPTVIPPRACSAAPGQDRHHRERADGTVPAPTGSPSPQHRILRLEHLAGHAFERGDLLRHARETLHHRHVGEHVAGARGDLVVQLLHFFLRLVRAAHSDGVEHGKSSASGAIMSSASFQLIHIAIGTIARIDNSVEVFTEETATGRTGYRRRTWCATVGWCGCRHGNDSGSDTACSKNIWMAARRRRCARRSACSDTSNGEKHTTAKGDSRPGNERVASGAPARQGVDHSAEQHRFQKVHAGQGKVRGQRDRQLLFRRKAARSPAGTGLQNRHGSFAIPRHAPVRDAHGAWRSYRPVEWIPAGASAARRG